MIEKIVLTETLTSPKTSSSTGKPTEFVRQRPLTNQMIVDKLNELAEAHNALEARYEGHTHDGYTEHSDRLETNFVHDATAPPQDTGGGQ